MCTWNHRIIPSVYWATCRIECFLCNSHLLFDGKVEKPFGPMKQFIRIKILYSVYCCKPNVLEIRHLKEKKKGWKDILFGWNILWKTSWHLRIYICYMFWAEFWSTYFVLVPFHSSIVTISLFIVNFMIRPWNEFHPKFTFLSFVFDRTYRKLNNFEEIFLLA